MDVNLTFGMSADYPMETGVFHMIQDGSVSVFNKPEGTKTVKNSLRNCAGLSNHNSIHNYMFFNGNKDKP